MDPFCFPKIEMAGRSKRFPLFEKIGMILFKIKTLYEKAQKVDN